MHSFTESHRTLVWDNKRRHVTRNLFLCGTVILVVGLICGILIGRFAICTEDMRNDGTFLPGVPSSIIQDADPLMSDKIINSIKAENIRQYLKELSEKPHMAGTPADWQQADDLRKFWKENGLDEVFINEYDVLLSYPNTTNEDTMNQIQILSSTGDIILVSPLNEEILIESENKSNVVPPFNAYSAHGTVESDELIYINYGRVEDYRYLDSINVNVSGKIVIAKYGKIYRGDKARLAAEHGAIGIILYSDPGDYAVGQTVNSQVYPNDWWLPPSGVQRGSLWIRSDPLTPGYPATETAYRVNESDAGLPTIPSHPIGYGFATKVLQQMTGNEVPDTWKGVISNVTYRFGGKLTNQRKIKLIVSTTNQRRKTYNVIGIIRGAVEPDRYVLLGNHRDAWVFGAIDPSSGTAVMKEISRVMGQLVKNNKWRPRRTIIFCSWGAEEYALIGSTEWVEQYVKNLAERSIAYLNVDLALEGNFSFKAKSTPLLYDTIFTATKKVANPNSDDGLKSVFDKWKHSFPTDPDATKAMPKVLAIGSGSDYVAMVQMVGLPSCDMRYTFDSNRYKLSSYPLYHSKYETFHVVDKIMDIGFKHHQAVAQVWAEIARQLSDALIIPLGVVDFASKVENLIDIFDKDYGTLLRRHGIKFDDLREVSAVLKNEAVSFTKRVENVNKNNPLAVRYINDQLMLFERAFLDPQGLPGRPYARHVLFAESSTNSYAGSSFPGLVDLLFDIENDKDQVSSWEKVKKHFSVILFTIDSAASTLRDVSKFMPDFVKKG